MSARPTGRGLVLATISASLAVLLGAPSIAATKGTIEGRVVNASTGEPQPDVAVTLTGGRVGDISKKTTTDRLGRYTFSGLPTGDEGLYALDARYAGGLFAGRAVSLPDDTARPPVIEGTLRVWETTTDPTAILVARDDLFVVPNEGGASVIESVTVTNLSDRAYIGRGGDRSQGGGAPSLAFSLPTAAQAERTRILEATLDIPRLVALEGLGGFGVTVAVPPGDTRITFTYPLSGVTGRFDLSRRALYPVVEHTIFTEEPLSLESDRLVAAGEQRLSGRTYLRWTSEDPLDAGDTIQAAALADAGSDPVLVGGMAAILIAVAAAAAFALVRSRRRAERPPEASAQIDSREELLVAIAELDVRRRNGQIAEHDWSLERARLKDRLRREPVH